MSLVAPQTAAYFVYPWFRFWWQYVKSPPPPSLHFMSEQNLCWICSLFYLGSLLMSNCHGYQRVLNNTTGYENGKYHRSYLFYCNIHVSLINFISIVRPLSPTSAVDIAWSVWEENIICIPTDFPYKDLEVQNGIYIIRCPTFLCVKSFNLWCMDA